MAKYYDTLIGEYILNPGRKGLSLEEIALNEFDLKQESYENITKKGELNFDEIPLKIAGDYASFDNFVIKKIYDSHKIDETDEKLLKEIDFPLVEVLADIENTGVKVDEKILSEIGEYLKIEIEKEKAEVFKLAGKEFNISSPKQVGEILFDDLGLPSAKKTKTGYSVDVEVLEGLSFKFPIAKHILNFRQYSKLLSTYIEGLSKIINKNTHKIHTSYNQAVTTTGRLSSTNPNLQNIPSSSSGVSGEIRKAFVPFEKDDVIMSFDYSQIEVRLLAIMSEDDNLLNAFKNNLDIHKNTGKFIFDKDELTTDERRIAKAVNFGVIYGISPFGLSKMIGISQADAKIYIEKFYETYPKVKEFFDKVILDCQQNGYVKTMFGRKRYIVGINDKNSMIQKSASREAINMPIQGTSADIIKIAMIKIYDFLNKNNLKSKMIMQVHDELVFNVKKDEIDLLKIKIPDIMENIIQSSISLTVGIGVGANWKDAK